MKKKVIIVTGATGTIGTALCKKLIDEGYFVLAISRSTNKKTIQKNIAYRSLDVSDAHSVETLFQESPLDGGILVGIVTCAGVLKMGPTDQFSDDDWNTTLGINTSGTFFMFKHAIKYMKQHKQGGLLVAISSRWNAGAKEATAYAASKAALQGMILSLQKELVGTPIRPVLVSPGSVASPMSDFVNQSINQELVKPQDMADLIAYLFSTPPRIIFKEITLLAYNYDFEDQYAK